MWGLRLSHSEEECVVVREGWPDNERVEVELLVREYNFQLLAIGRTGL